RQRTEFSGAFTTLTPDSGWFRYAFLVSDESPAIETCPPDTAFVGLVEGRIAESEAQALHRHLAGCGACREVVRRLFEGAPDGEGRHRPGDVVDGRYRIVRLLGEGGMGSVFEAEVSEPAAGRRVALKLINRQRVDPRSGARERFRREAQVAGT